MLDRSFLIQFPCRIRIDADEERTGVGGKTYHPDCYAELFSAVPKPIG